MEGFILKMGISGWVVMCDRIGIEIRRGSLLMKYVARIGDGEYCVVSGGMIIIGVACAC